MHLRREMMDGMRRSRYFTYASFFGWVRPPLLPCTEPCWHCICYDPHQFHMRCAICRHPFLCRVQVWNIILLLPHSIAVVLAYPEAILKQGASGHLHCWSDGSSWA